MVASPIIVVSFIVLDAWGPETGFFYENISLQPVDSVKNPVSLV